MRCDGHQNNLIMRIICRLSYYDRWLRAMVALCIEEGVFSKEEWLAKRQQVERKSKAIRMEKVIEV